MEIDIVFWASVITALGIIGGALIGAYKYLETPRKETEKNRKDIKKMKTEQAIMCEGIGACLDGLLQLGANHNVSKVKQKLDEHLNKAAHDEE